MHILQQIEHECLTYLIIESRVVVAAKQINEFLRLRRHSEQEVEENETTRRYYRRRGGL